jgi:hypothetical protein
MPDPFISSDAASVEFQRRDLKDAVRSTDRRTQLEGIRDYITHELEGNLCNTCKNSKLRTGDQASLIKRLEDVLDDIANLPKEEGQSRLAAVRNLAAVPQTATGTDGDDPTTRRRTGDRRPGGGRK